MIAKHSDERPHKCDQCSYSTVQLSALKRHKLVHSDTKPYSCPHCTYKAKEKRVLDYHIRTTHTKDKLFNCDHCSYSSAMLSNLKRHKLIHSDTKPNSCPHCPYKTKQRGVLNKHIKAKHTNTPKISTDSLKSDFIPVSELLVD